MKYRSYPKELKEHVLIRLAAGSAVKAIAEELGIGDKQIYRWRAEAREVGADGLRGIGRPRQDEAAAHAASLSLGLDPVVVARRRIAELERKVGQQELDLDFFRQALRHVKARRQQTAGRGGLTSTRSSKR